MAHRLSQAWRKNGPELTALLSGRMPGFAWGGRAVRRVPVFVFHEVAPARFEAQLRFLRANGYRTLDADALADALQRRGPADGAVGLTFDDATWTFWAFAFPLLRRYGYRAILFAIPGLVPDDSTSYPSLEDVWADRHVLPELQARAALQPLCTWQELAAMSESGLVDIQSHSLTHSRIAVSPRVVDFLNPDFDTYFFGNVNVPVSACDDPERPERQLRLGAPVFQSASRLTCRPRYREDPELVDALTRYVDAQGGTRFFAAADWHRKLRRQLAGWRAARGRFETDAETTAAARRELTRSRQLLEDRLGKPVRHFCYPWFEGSARADQLAAEAGYRSVHYGVLAPRRGDPTARWPLAVPRLSEEYLRTLPGTGRLPFRSVWYDRVRHFARRSRTTAS